MTGFRPGGQPRPFGADELDGVSGLHPDELAADTRMARELQASASRTSVRPSSDFTDRVMAAVGKEPVAAPARAARIALRHGAFGAFLVALRDAWRVTGSPAFPMAMRVQAMALVLVVGGLVAGGGVVTAGALGLLEGDLSAPSPAPTVATPATPVPTPTVTEPPSELPASLEPSPSPEPSASDPDQATEPAESADPAEPTETDEPAVAAPPTTRSAPTLTPGATETPQPTASPTPGGEHGGEPSDPPQSTRTPRPSPTPSPSPTHE